MKYWFSYFLSVVLLSVIFSLFLWFFTPDSQKQQSLTSPLPEFLSLAKNKQVTILDLWEPVLEVLGANSAKMPEVTAQSALMYDLSANKVLYEKDARERLPMASLTKIMTAIVAIENKQEDDEYIVRPESLVGEDSMGLTSGEVLTLEELLYGLLLPSGNDAAETLAGNYQSGRGGFISAMNDKAKALGLKNTNFTNPSGLQGDGNQYTTAHDLLVITKYAVDTYPILTEVTSTSEKQLPQTATHKEFYLYNETNLITSYPGVRGIKTGYTPEAGLCLVTYLEYDGHKIVGILLNSQKRREEMKELLDYSLRELGTTPPSHS
ncbi:MAG: D-alanyl-D-alanine carboxypeptidase [Candidatus Levybacteria bacterium]|nr:D-alanyl-D-alanine carboxypeptidase [Candidatus Levybacteria bacterium]